MAYVTKYNIKEKADEWLKMVSQFNRHDLDISQMKTALLVVDMQRYFTHEEGGAYLEASEAIMDNVKSLIDHFRAKRWPIIFTRHVHKSDGSDLGIMDFWWGENIMEDMEDSELNPEIAPEEDEKVFEKTRYNAFYKTDLDRYLKRRKIECLAICGVMTNLCCESTAREAFIRDFKVIFIADATATITEAMHVGTLTNLAYGFAEISRTSYIIGE